MDPYCFIITSYGKRDNLKDMQAKIAAKNIEQAVQLIDFDKIYNELMVPALKLAQLEPLIEKEEESFGSIHKTMYEKILLCEFCIADLTNLNPNVYYELGMRYAVKPHTTIPIIASLHHPLPFDVNGNRTFTYSVDKDFNLSNKEEDIKNLANALNKAKQKRETDSPLYDLVNGIEFQNAVAHEKTDVFRDRVVYDQVLKDKLAYARNLDGDRSKRVEAINKIVEDNRPLENVETAVLIDMMISYRNIEAFTEMQDFIEQLPRYVFETVMVQEQYAFVLNRNAGKKKPVDEVMIAKAENALKKLEQANKASSETYGIWGRIHKDKFDRAYKAEDKGAAAFHLKNALKYYQKGFEADSRDAYPGVNYVTCLELSNENDKAKRMVPAVEVAVRNKMLRKEPDYWDYASLFELAVIERNYDNAASMLEQAKPLAVEAWMFDTTRGNLEKNLRYRTERGEDTGELQKLIEKIPQVKNKSE